MGAKLYNGIKVLDFTNNYAGPITTAMMADYGAEVIHIEKPVLGDDVRHYPPIFDGVSTAHSVSNRGKKSLVLDLKDSRGIEIFKKLAKEVDVVVESNRPGVMKRLGLDYENLKEINPGLVYCSISAYGQNGPYAQRPGYDIIAQAVSGFMELTGEKDGPPMKTGIVLGDWMGGLTAFGAIGTALYYKEKTGKGQHIDVSLVRSLLWACSILLNYKNVGKAETRSGNQHESLCPYGVFHGSNGQNLVIAALSSKLWCDLCDLMGVPEYGNDPRYVTTDKRVENRKDVIALIENWLQTFEHIEDAEKLLLEKGVPCAKVYSAADIVNDPHYNQVGWFADVPTSEQMKSKAILTTTSAPVTFSETAAAYTAAPELGEHNQEILKSLGYSEEAIEALESEWAEKAKKKLRR